MENDNLFVIVERTSDEYASAISGSLSFTAAKIEMRKNLKETKRFNQFAIPSSLNTVIDDEMMRDYLNVSEMLDLCQFNSLVKIAHMFIAMCDTRDERKDGIAPLFQLEPGGEFYPVPNNLIQFFCEGTEGQDIRSTFEDCNNKHVYGAIDVFYIVEALIDSDVLCTLGSTFTALGEFLR